ncbi:hypothetical protein TNIN_305351 [Trichonephila inaurata madagascariensis]|uniref:Uncharacterized protein n=1 Tax=Trichonephila inaurata madagascariensis TaxID=2747483 RepID=A0A8X6YB92_9ARAC|nr:hypothetical protein TNIN_305351 [Trichonephila inaurata madagascariensis]
MLHETESYLSLTCNKNESYVCIYIKSLKTFESQRSSFSLHDDFFSEHDLISTFIHRFYQPLDQRTPSFGFQQIGIRIHQFAVSFEKSRRFCRNRRRPVLTSVPADPHVLILCSRLAMTVDGAAGSRAHCGLVSAFSFFRQQNRYLVRAK